jgi:hypothetical protein
MKFKIEFLAATTFDNPKPRCFVSSGEVLIARGEQGTYDTRLQMTFTEENGAKVTAPYDRSTDAWLLDAGGTEYQVVKITPIDV